MHRNKACVYQKMREFQAKETPSAKFQRIQCVSETVCKEQEEQGQEKVNLQKQQA